MKLRLLFTSSGNGWVGSRPIGVMIGAISSRKKRRTQVLIFSVQ